MGLTPPQFDVIAELGGTQGMTYVELSQSTYWLRPVSRALLIAWRVKALLSGRLCRMTDGLPIFD